MKILCFGSLNIDYTYKVEHFVQKGETISSQSLQVFSGGKGLNQSIALAKAGAEVYHAGAVGTDGGFLLRQLEEAGVNTEHVVVFPVPPFWLAIAITLQFTITVPSSYYKVVVFIDPLQGLYAILFGDTVDWFSPPTT